MRIAPRAAWRFALGNVLLCVGVALTAQRGPEPSYLFYPLANLVNLVAIVALREGVQRLLHLPQSVREHTVLLILVTVGTFWPEPGPASMFILSGVFSVAIVWVATQASRDCLGALSKEFGVLTTLGIALPFIGIALLSALRLVGLLVNDYAPLQASVQANAVLSVPLLWGHVGLMVMSNVSIIGVTIGRLVLKVRELADRDVLTGLWNRRALELAIKRERALLQRSERLYSLAVCDLDHFKRINDELGHAAGDAVLRHTAGVLQTAARELDIVGRFGGEEFLVVMPMTDVAGARGAAERLRAKLMASPLKWQGNPITVTASFGIAQADAQGDDELFRRADAALYRAKARGRNRVEVEPGSEARSAPGNDVVRSSA
jgi:diguanylate cyclase (GGDEF)-like protein